MMKTIFSRALLAGALFGFASAAAPLFADVSVTNVWQGANTSGKTAADNDIDDAANWSLGHVPKAGECAYIKFASNQAHLYIGETSAFAPTEWFMDFNNLEKNVYLDKSLTLTHFKLNAGSQTIYSGNKLRNRFYIGTKSQTPVTLKVTDDGEAFDLRGASSSWISICWSTNSVIEFAGKKVDFSRRDYNSATIFMQHTDGGIGVQGVNIPVKTTVSSMVFSDPDAIVTLGNQNYRRDGTLGPGYGEIHCHSTQTWNCDPLSFVDFNDTFASSTAFVPVYFKSLDGGRLDNLSNVNIIVWHRNSDNTDNLAVTRKLTAGTYGSVYNYGGTTSLRNSFVTLAGDVRLAGRAVNVKNYKDAPAATLFDYSYVCAAMDGNNYHYLALNGYTLELAHGMGLYPNKKGGVYLNGGTLVSEGDIYVYSSGVSATNSSPVTDYGFMGKNGRILLAGNYHSNMRSTSQGSLSTDTVEMIGGGREQKWEVGDKASASGLATKSSFCIGTYKVGVGTTNAYVTLVNECLNDNPTSLATGDDVNTARVGEKLIVGNLSIADASTFNVNSQQVQVVTSLAIASTGTLRVDAGETTEVGDAITNVVGIGDQSEAWNAVASRVVDTSNPKAKFKAVYDSAANVTRFVRKLPGLILFVR